jgi:hypothetical protein
MRGSVNLALDELDRNPFNSLIGFFVNNFPVKMADTGNLSPGRGGSGNLLESVQAEEYK